MKTILPWTLALLASIAAIHFWREGQALQSRLVALNTEITSERTRNQEELERLKSRQIEAETRYKTDTQELLKLRDQARLSREQSSELERTRQEVQRLQAQATQRLTHAPAAQPEIARPVQTGGSFPREQWNFAGYQTPEAALVSAIWAMKEGNPTTYLQSLAPAEQERISKLWADKSESDIIAKHQSDVSRITGFQILGSDITSDSEIILSVEIQGVGRKEQVNMQKVGGEWKFGGFIRR